MRNPVIAPLVATLAAIPCLTMAESTIGYNYLQFDSLVSSELSLEGASESLNGFGIAGSTLLHRNVIASAQGNHYTLSKGKESWDQHAFGIAGRFSILQRGAMSLDFHAGLSYEALSIDGSGFAGHGLTVGFRFMPTSTLEINSSFSKIDYGDNLAFTGDPSATEIKSSRVQIGALYHLSENFSVSVQLRTEHLEVATDSIMGDEESKPDLEQIRVGVRRNF